MAVKQVNMHEAKSRLSELGELAWQGEKIVIARAGKPYLDLVPHRNVSGKRKPGRLKGQIRMAADFDETPPEVLADFEG
jgi:antitoxin (DNA-binding transcriptional repressor) of toxin-antitoxin stability system